MPFGFGYKYQYVWIINPISVFLYILNLVWDILFGIVDS